jgi:hypothetical protein
LNQQNSRFKQQLWKHSKTFFFAKAPFPAHSGSGLVCYGKPSEPFIRLKPHTSSCRRSICRRSAVNLQVILSKAHPMLGCYYAILYQECASDKIQGLMDKRRHSEWKGRPEERL